MVLSASFALIADMARAATLFQFLGSFETGSFNNSYATS